MRRRSNGVQARNYVTHIVRDDGVRTLCGREATKVNTQGRNEPPYEGTCARCAKIKKGNP